MVDVARIVTARGLAEALAFRDGVLVGEQGVAASDARDEFDRDPSTLHCVAVDSGGACVGTGRLTAPVDAEVDGDVVEGIPAIGPIVVSASADAGETARSILAYLEAEALALYGRNGTVRVVLRPSVNVHRGAWAPGLGVLAPFAAPHTIGSSEVEPEDAPFPRRAPSQHEPREARA